MFSPDSAMALDVSALIHRSMEDIRVELPATACSCFRSTKKRWFAIRQVAASIRHSAFHLLYVVSYVLSSQSSF